MVRRGAAVARLLARPAHLADVRWMARAFRDHDCIAGTRGGALVALAHAARGLVPALAAWRADGAQGAAFARRMRGAAHGFDDRTLRRRGERLRTYVDVSVAADVVRAFAGFLAERPAPVLRVPAHELTALLLRHFPTDRPVLLAHAELLLDAGDADGAIDASQRALHVQAVCITAQRLLFRAYRLKRAQGSDDPALAAADYDLSDRFCRVPFTHLSTGWKGNAFACSCPAWVPFPVGNVFEAPTADALWNSDAAVEIRRSVLDGDFSYCSRTLCSYISAQRLPKKDDVTDPVMRGFIDGHVTRLPVLPQLLELNYDATCNLACPSCRTEIIAAKGDERDALTRARDNVVLPLLRQMQGGCYVSGGGEVFSSPHFRSILAVLNPRDYPGVRLHLITNGQLLTPERWRAYPDLPAMIGTLSVAVDAACAETYERLRPPGKWSVLMRNLEHLGEMRRAGVLRDLWLNFVVQRANYREMFDFVALGQRLGADHIWFQRVTNYGAYDPATFVELDVTSPDHPEHAELLAILRDPRMKGPMIRSQMLLPLLPEMVGSLEAQEQFPG